MRKPLLLILSYLLCCITPSFAQHSQRDIVAADPLFAAAYARYPGIPKGLLEATAYAASRMVNLQPHGGSDHHNCTGMPERFGVFGLIEDGKGYFRNNLLAVCRLSDITPAQFKQDVGLQIMAVARYLQQLAVSSRLAPAAGIEDYAGVLEQLSELPADESDVARYARSLYTYDVYYFLQQGFETPSLKRAPVKVQLQRIYPPETLRLLQSPGVQVDYDLDRVRVPGVPVTPVSNGVTGGVHARSAEYPPAIFDPAHTANYQVGRGGSRPTNVTVHTTQGSYAGTISWFKNPSSSVSAHYVIRSSDGQVTQMVSENNTAWHVRSNNGYTIGIEHEGFVDDGPRWYTENMYRSSAALVRDICDSWGIDRSACFRGPATAGVNFLPIGVRIKGHQHYSGNTHTDPGVHWNWGKYADLIKPTAIIIPNGVYRVLNHNSGKSLDARGCSGNNSVQMNQWDWWGGDCQRWRFEHVGDGWYKISGMISGRVLDVPSCSGNDGTVLQFWDWLDNDCQRWRLEDAGDGLVRIVNKASGKVMEIGGGSVDNGGTVMQYSWNGGNWQKWRLNVVSTNYIAEGTYTLSTVSNGKALQAQDCNTAWGTSISQWEQNGTDCQRWRIEPTADGFYRLVSVKTGLVLDVASCNQEQGGSLIQWEWLDNDCQRWNFEHLGDGRYKVIAYTSGKVLDASDTSNGARVYQWGWWGGANQQWVLNAATAARVAAIKPVAAVAKLSLRLAPNPVSAGAVAQLYYVLDGSHRSTAGTLLVTDQQGHLLRQQVVGLQPGSNNLSVSTTGWPAGIYYISLRNHANNKTEHIRLVLVR